MFETPPTALAYVGARPYIRGADVLGHFLLHPPANEDLAVIQSFRSRRPVTRDGVWRVGAPASDADPAATLKARRADGEPLEAAFFETGVPIERRDPDVASFVERLDETAPFEGEATLRPIGGSMDFMNACVEANKALHSRVLDDPGKAASIRLAYIERLPVVGPFPRTLAIRKRSERSHAGSIYTLASLEGAEAPRPTMLCFYYDEEPTER